MGLMPKAVLPDGSILTVFVGTDRALYAHRELADGTPEKVNLAGAVIYRVGGLCTSPPELEVIGGRVIIDVLGVGGTGGAGGDAARFWVPWRIVYTHDPAKALPDRFGRFRAIGGTGSRVAPVVPPLL